MTTARSSWAKAVAVGFTAAISLAGSTALAQSGGTAPQAATEADALAIYHARLAAQQANNEANLAAASASYNEGLAGAKEGVLKDQLKMVGNAVKNWKAPRGYAASHSIASTAIEDPFAAATPAQSNTTELQTAMGTSGLEWDDERQLARVTTTGVDICGGRLKVGDYPTLPDGNLLDTPARITQFVATCTGQTSPLLVVVETGEVVVRK
jgi:hypothetical protein